MKAQDFLTLPDGRIAKRYTLTGANGMKAEISDFGGVVLSLCVPDINGNSVDVALGYRDPQDYLVNAPHFGAMVGRVANRVSNAEFMLDGICYHLVKNKDEHSLHGGIGYSHRLWTVVNCTENRLELELFSPDGDAGYPGNLTVTVCYTVTDDNTLEIEMRGVTDAVTVVNLTNHSYFNLSGESAGSLLDHQVAVYAARRQDVDAELIPTGRLIDVQHTAYDLREFTALSTAFKALPQGFDTSYVFCDDMGELRLQGAARSATTGIRLDVLSTDCALQLYTGGGLSGTDVGKSGNVYPKLSGFCFETQHLVDSPNHPSFPTIRLEAGEAYYQKVCYKFSTEQF